MSLPRFCGHRIKCDSSLRTLLDFGEVRWQNGTIPTDRTFTGQLAEPSGLGSLMDYNAREYSPVLGRFLSADTIVPNPGNPNSFNRYSYVENSSLKYTDPSGHCPQPPTNIGSGNIICIAGFIPTKTSKALGYDYQGDNRSFTPFGDRFSESSRVWAWIDAVTGRIIDPDTGMPTDKGDFHFTAKTDGTGRWDPLPDNKFTSEKDENGNIVLKYDFRCSDPGPNCAAGPDGTITFKPNQFGSFDTQGDVVGFPNLEAYHWKDGKLYAGLFYIRNFSKEEEQSGVGKFMRGASMAENKTNEFAGRIIFQGTRFTWDHAMQQPNDALNVAYPPDLPY